jgi:hypothetical protein
MAGELEGTVLTVLERPPLLIGMSTVDTKARCPLVAVITRGVLSHRQVRVRRGD